MPVFVPRRFLSAQQSRRFPKKKTPQKKLVKKVNKIAKAIKAEIRVSNVFNAATVITQAGILQEVNSMAAGDGDQQREGLQTNMLSVRIDADLNMPFAGGTTTDACENVRMLLVYDRQSNTAQPVIADLLQNNASAPRNWFAPAFWRNRKRFKILIDKNYQMKPEANTRQAVGATTLDACSKRIRIKKKLNLPVFYNAVNGGTFADIVKGCLTLIFITETALGNTSVTSNTQLLYNP